MGEIRLLNANEIECKVSTISEKGCSLLLYKTARTDMDILDEMYGPMNWDCDYKEIKGNMYCGISVFNEKANKWVTKWDCGVESAFGDKEKGEASDAFKRAGFKWGIGRELYTAPFIWVNAQNINLKANGNKYSTFDKFEVAEIGYNEKREISKLVITNTTMNCVAFTLNAPQKTQKTQEPQLTQEQKQTVNKIKEEKQKITSGTIKQIAILAKQFADARGRSVQDVYNSLQEKFKYEDINKLSDADGKALCNQIMTWTRAAARTRRQ